MKVDQKINQVIETEYKYVQNFNKTPHATKRLYLLEIEQSLFQEDDHRFNVNTFPNYLKSLLNIPGINSSVVYVGAKDSIFGLHILKYIIVYP